MPGVHAVVEKQVSLVLSVVSGLRHTAIVYSTHLRLSQGFFAHIIVFFKMGTDPPTDSCYVNLVAVVFRVKQHRGTLPHFFGCSTGISCPLYLISVISGVGGSVQNHFKILSFS